MRPENQLLGTTSDLLGEHLEICIDLCEEMCFIMIWKCLLLPCSGPSEAGGGGILRYGSDLDKVTDVCL